QAIVLSLLSGLDKNKILKVLPKIKPIKGRLNIIKNRYKIICIDYAHTPDGLEKVIKTLKNHFKKNVNIVFGCGGNRDIGKRFKMGQVVNKYCKQIIITDDNPRNENPKQITKQIFQSVRRGQIIQNRKTAIKTGIKITKKNEILLIAGKGHENYQIFKNRKIFFSDFEEVSNNL
ncbi:MAG: cyanophycin synthetase, partial [Pelagibacteraceae bacterium]